MHLNGKGPFPFLLDTGAERSVIGKALSERLALKAGKPVIMQSMAQRGMVKTVHVDDMRMSLDGVSDLEMPVLQDLHMRAPGIIGLDSLQNSKVLFNFKDGAITVRHAEKDNRSARQPRDRNVIVVRAQRRHGRLVVSTADLAGKRVQVVIDTGAEMSMGNAALRRLLLRRHGDDPSSLATFHDVAGAPVNAQVAKLPDLKIGRLIIAESHVALTDAPVFEELGLKRRPALLLGMNAIRQLERLEVDFPNRRVTFVTDERASRDARKDIAAR